ncbi:hypothetical protein KR100_06770 [Synechococcus sp. KORDI-100]|uniref:tetratricopeptide repeat protein n=1 Tax=Synechococcus sp. KORDI-100 TaxID=1280380 RepID=UPI0004E061C1|nr:tetratricopeptide repeat protein [Synechococcus sp. KORDI-100]AII43067.1 hypothetical protein KR100_06770 [Synechococcus sp. KORDI-100]
MTRVTTAFAAALALFLPIGRPLLVGLTPAVGIGAGLLSTQQAYAMTAEDWIVSGNLKYINDDLQGAIADYTKAIEIDPNYAAIYLVRAKAKYELKNYQGAIEDYTKAIEINPKYAMAIFTRGLARKYVIGDLEGACSDWRKAAELGDEEAANWVEARC